MNKIVYHKTKPINVNRHGSGYKLISEAAYREILNRAIEVVSRENYTDESLSFSLSNNGVYVVNGTIDKPLGKGISVLQLDRSDLDSTEQVVEACLSLVGFKNK
ncbi:MAG: hypothetical protein ACF8K1_05360 [Phycisphaerales bacterium JB047]